MRRRAAPRRAGNSQDSNGANHGGGFRWSGPRDLSSEPRLDRFTRLATRLLDVPVALITLAGQDHQYISNEFVLRDTWSRQGDRSLWALLCDRITASGTPEFIDDARSVPAAPGTPGNEELGVSAFAGIPLHSTRGEVIGCLCVAHIQPRRWTDDDRLTLFDLAAAATTEFELHQRSLLLREQEARFRSLVQQTSDIILLVDEDGTIRYASPAIERVLGYRPVTVVGTRIFDTVHPDDASRIAAAFQRGSQRTKGHWSIEFRARHRDGSWRYVEAAATNLLRDHSVEGIVVNVRDVTERKQAEAERAVLLEREAAARIEAEAAHQRYYDLVQGVDAIVWEADATTWHVSFVSQRAEELLGYPVSEWLSGPQFWARLIHPEDYDGVVLECREAIERQESHDLEYRVIASDGRVLWVRDLICITYGADGRRDQLRGVMVDITTQKQHGMSLEASEARFRSLVQNAMDMIVLIDAATTILYVSPSAKRILGYQPAEMLGQLLFDYVHADDFASTAATLGDILDEPGGMRRSRARLRAADGAWHWVDGIGTNLLHDPGVGGIVVNVRDVTERVRVEEALRASEERNRAQFKGIPIPTYTWQRRGDDFFLIDFNDAADAFTKGAIRDLLDRPASETLRDFPEMRADMERSFRQRSTIHPQQLQSSRSGDSTRHLEITFVYVPSDLVMVHTQDVTERTELEQELRHQAFYDSLTNLPNRALFLDRLSHALAAGVRRQSQIAVLFLDLDSFKMVNDSLGHPGGDALLAAVAHRFLACMRSSDTLARFGGDEFVVLLEGLQSHAQAIGVAERLLASIRAGVEIDGRELYITTSIGIAVSTIDDLHLNPDGFLRRADVALYQAKAAGKNRFALYNPAVQHRSSERLDLQADLSRALDRGELILHYQPELELASGMVVGVEALVRWQHPRHGLLYPAAFIPLAEETGQIAEIDRWVLRQACRQIRQWQVAQPDRPPLQLSVNLSPRQLDGPNLVDEVARVLSETAIEPHTLWLELTESTLMDDTLATRALLAALRELDVRLALDDFGTGYSSLSYLCRLPVGMLKLDRSFITAMERDSGSRAVVQAVTALAHALEIQVTAEGVETAGQLEHLRTLGCDWVQGYYISTPLPPDAIGPLLGTPSPWSAASTNQSP